MDDLESLKEKAAHHYTQFHECMDAMFEIDDVEASGFQEYWKR